MARAAGPGAAEEPAGLARGPRWPWDPLVSVEEGVRAVPAPESPEV